MEVHRVGSPAVSEVAVGFGGGVVPVGVEEIVPDGTTSVVSEFSACEVVQRDNKLPDGQNLTCSVTNILSHTLSSKTLHDLCPLSVCSVSLPHSLHLNPVSGVGLEGGQSVGGVTVGRLGDNDGAILGGVGHSEGVALGVVG